MLTFFSMGKAQLRFQRCFRPMFFRSINKREKENIRSGHKFRTITEALWRCATTCPKLIENNFSLAYRAGTLRGGTAVAEGGAKGWTDHLQQAAAVSLGGPKTEAKRTKDALTQLMDTVSRGNERGEREARRVSWPRKVLQTAVTAQRNAVCDARM